MLNHGFLTDLHQLASGFDDDLGEIAENISDITDALRQAVSGSAGLQLTVVRYGQPVTIDATFGEPGARTTTSLRVPLPLLSPGFEPGGRVVFYSTVPGALVDLAADLTHVLDPDGGQIAAVELDADLPLVPGGPLLTGLDEITTLNRAAGVLIDQGQHPETAHQVLRRRAAAAGTTTVAFAHHLLGR